MTDAQRDKLAEERVESFLADLAHLILPAMACPLPEGHLWLLQIENSGRSLILPTKWTALPRELQTDKVQADVAAVQARDHIGLLVVVEVGGHTGIMVTELAVTRTDIAEAEGRPFAIHAIAPKEMRS